MVLAVGAEETQEFLRQHAEYAAGWQGRGLRLAEVDMAGLHHFSAVDALADRGHGLHAAVRQLLAGRSAWTLVAAVVSAKSPVFPAGLFVWAFRDELVERNSGRGTC